MSSGGSSPTQTVVQQQQIPQYEQQYSQNNLNLAQSLQSNPYPAYQAPLVAGMSGMQNQGLNAVENNVGAYGPALKTANNALQTAQSPLNTAAFNANPAATQAWNQPGVAQSYINPYVQSSLMPQLSLMNQQLQQQNNATGLQAAGDNAFGDARTGVQEGVNRQATDLAQQQLIGQGYNTAYAQGMQGQQANMAGAQNEQAVLGNLGGQFGQLAGQYGQLGSLQQGLGLTGAGALYNAGAQQQGLKQQQYNTAYQQFQNQANWPFQMLSVGESALANNPYTVTNTMSAPNPNPLLQGLGTFATLAGGTGGLANAFGSGGNNNSASSPAKLW